MSMMAAATSPHTQLSMTEFIKRIMMDDCNDATDGTSASDGIKDQFRLDHAVYDSDQSARLESYDMMWPD